MHGGMYTNHQTEWCHALHPRNRPTGHFPATAGGERRCTICRIGTVRCFHHTWFLYSQCICKPHKRGRIDHGYRQSPQLPTPGTRFPIYYPSTTLTGWPQQEENQYLTIPHETLLSYPVETQKNFGYTTAGKFVG